MSGPAGEAMRTVVPVLSTAKVSKSFGGVQALREVTIEFPPSGVVALVGPNGAGKTTLFNLLSGLLEPDAGECRIDGRSIVNVAPHRIAQLGIGRTFQDAKLVRQMTALDNICLARPEQAGETLLLAFAGRRSRAEEATNREYGCQLLRRLGLEDVGAVAAGALSFGQQRLLSLGCCLAMGSRVLLLDEPLTGLHSSVGQAVMALIGEIGAAGRLVIFIEHDLKAVSRLADEVIVLHQGSVLARGAPADALNSPEVAQAYVG